MDERAPSGRRRIVAWLLALAGATAVLAGCGADDDGDRDGNGAAVPGATAPGPGAADIDDGHVPPSVRRGDVYAPPDPLPEGRPGDLLALADLDVPAGAPAGARAWRMLHLSLDVHDEAIAVSGIVAVPGGDPPDGGWPVLSYAHGTTGAADVCAPSRSPQLSTRLAGLLAEGWAVAATDYEGLGTPGPHPYLLGASQARGVLDAARAARALDPRIGEQVAVVGHSQGGHAALFVAETAHDYAPDLDVVGSVAAAPPTDLVQLLRATIQVPQVFGFTAMSIHGWAGTYAELEADQLLTPAGMGLLEMVEEACIGEVLGVFDRPLAELLAVSPLDEPSWRRRMEENSAGRAPVQVPLLVVQGDDDLLVPAPFTAAYVETACRLGGPIVHRSYAGVDHGGIAVASAGDVRAWLEDRLAGGDPPDDC